MSTDKQLAGNCPSDGTVRPVAWWARSENGNIRCWTSAPAESLRLAQETGFELAPLYDQAALAMLAGELQALRNHVAHWERGGIDAPAIARADDALRLYHVA